MGLAEAEAVVAAAEKNCRTPTAWSIKHNWGDPFHRCRLSGESLSYLPEVDSQESLHPYSDRGTIERITA
jgi:hypothetical protein